jgi:hypothetical protein
MPFFVFLCDLRGAIFSTAKNAKEREEKRIFDVNHAEKFASMAGWDA